MKKVLIFTIMMTVSLCLSAQTVNDFISEKTKDVAYTAPNTMFVNKKWFSFDRDLETYNTQYYMFRANKTGELVNVCQYEDCSFEQVLPFTWYRDHNNLSIRLNFKNLTYRKLVYADPSASARKKAEIKNSVDIIMNKKKNDSRVIDLYINKYYINRLDDKLLLLEGLKLEIQAGGESKTDSADDVFLCTEAGKKELKATKNKAADTKDSSN